MGWVRHGFGFGCKGFEFGWGRDGILGQPLRYFVDAETDCRFLTSAGSQGLPLRRLGVVPRPSMEGVS
jgi:hypothetical protein